MQQQGLVVQGGLGIGVMRQVDPSLYIFSAKLVKGKGKKGLKKVEREIFSEIKRLQKKPISEQRLEMAKNQYIADLLFSLDTAHSLAEGIGMFYLYTSDPLALNKLIDCYRQVTAEQIRQVLKTYLNKQNSTLVTLLPKQKPETKG